MGIEVCITGCPQTNEHLDNHGGKMQRFKNILVVVDRKHNSQTFIDRAVDLARTNQSRLSVITFLEKLAFEKPESAGTEPGDLREPGINIIEKIPSEVPERITPETIPVADLSRDSSDTVSQKVGAPISRELHMVIQEKISETANVYLEKIIESIQKSGVQASGKVLDGTPFLEIIREVLRNGHDLVMIAAEGEGGFRQMLFGSTTMHLMRKCPCPVWVFKPDQSKHITRILAAIDPTPDDETRNALNTKIMELATSLARSEGSELIVIHAWTAYGETMLSGRAGVPQHQIDEMVRETRTAHQRRLVTFLRKYPLENLRHRVYLLKGNPGRLIPALAKALNIELIVMGTVCRTGVAGLLIGNTSEQVLNQVNCSVLTIKPEGFITPVRLDEQRE